MKSFSLILENDLIKKNKPKLNVRLKDDKSFPYIKIKNRIPELVKKLKTEQNKFVWFKAASAIMTTDTRPKVAYEECKIGNKLVKISGIAKGSGMIFPNMATTLGFVFTDANLSPSILKHLIKKKCKKIILGCTELPIAIFAYKSFRKAKESKLFIDPNLLLAEVCMKKYRKK